MTDGERGPPVPDVEQLYRGIVPQWWLGDRVSSAAFNFPAFSVDRASLTTPVQTLSRLKHGMGLVEFNTGVARRLGFDARHEPEQRNDAHAHVYCDHGTGERKRKARMLASQSELVIPPTGERRSGQ